MSGRSARAGQLARMELQIVLHTLLRRIPTLRLAAVTGAGSPVQGVRFAAAVDKSRLSILHASKELICKNKMDLKLIGALEQ